MKRPSDLSFSPIVSVDLAQKRYEDIGIAVLLSSTLGVEVAFEGCPLHGGPSPVALAAYLVDLCEGMGARTLMLDGPQAWKARDNGLEHSRVCERLLNTPAKTGLPGYVKPANYRPFVEFCVNVFDELTVRNWPRFLGDELPGARVAAETFPFSAWRLAGLPSLPAKRRCTPEVLAKRAELLGETYAVKFSRAPSHDELQATISGLAGIALARRERSFLDISGVAPFWSDGHPREGFIVNPVQGSCRWLVQSSDSPVVKT